MLEGAAGLGDDDRASLALQLADGLAAELGHEALRYALQEGLDFTLIIVQGCET